MKIVFGAVDNYSWNDIKVWAQSLYQSGFSGEVVVIVYRAAQDLIDNCIELGFTVVQAEHDEFGNPIDHHKFGLPTQAHKLRNFHAYQYLMESPDVYNIDTVIMTDTRDVWFQRNPDTFFSAPLTKIYMPSENVLFKNEPWNLGMVQTLFGDVVAQTILDEHACNSGTFFGSVDLMIPFLLNMYLLERNFSSTGSDQPTMNVLGRMHPSVDVLGMDCGWAFQCGTTIDPTKSFPQIIPLTTLHNWDGTKMTTSDGVEYIIVHQYDRVPELRTYIESLY